MLFAILTYELTYISGIFGNVNDDVKRKDIQEFNSQFEGFASREVGYANIPKAISVQEFAGIYNLVQDWNKEYPSDIIEVTINKAPGIPQSIGIANGDLIEQYKGNLEKFFENINQTGNINSYYFIFDAADIVYNRDGRVQKIKVEFRKM